MCKVIQHYSNDCLFSNVLFMTDLSTREVFPTPGAPIKITFADRIEENWWLIRDMTSFMRIYTVPLIMLCSNILTHFCWHS